MRRALLAVAVVLTFAASPAFAGYIIIRVLISGGTGGTGEPGFDGGNFPYEDERGSGGPFQLGGPGGTGGGFTPPVPGMENPNDPSKQATADPSRGIVVVIPMESYLVRERLEPTKAPNDFINPVYSKFYTYYQGKRIHPIVFVDNTTIQIYNELLDKPLVKKTYTDLMRDKYTEWSRSKADPAVLYDALILALQAGVIRETIPTGDKSPPKDAINFAKELLEVAAAKKLTLPPNVQQFVDAWGKVQKGVNDSPAQTLDAETWKVRIDARRVRTRGHYSLIYWDSYDSEVDRRLAQLNDNFAAFFLWHATRGIALTVPDKPLTAVLAPEGRVMLGLRKALDGMPSRTPAFYSSDHNLLVLSPERLDGVSQSFLRQNHQVFVQGLSRDPLLKGEVPKIHRPGQEGGSKPDDVARATTLALVEKFFAQEGDIAAVSSEGSRQLLYETGRLPKHVTLPNWLSSGAVSYFARPNGPAYITKGDEDKPYMTVAPRNGYDLPNYVQDRYFRDLDEKKELNADRAKFLENVLKDAYFTGIKNGDDPDPAPPVKKKKTTKPKVGPPLPGRDDEGQPDRRPPFGGFPGIPGGLPGIPGTGQPLSDEENPLVILRQKQDRLTVKANATAWALYYYLANEKPKLLEAFLGELNKLPRDLPIDGRTAFNTFVKVFDLAEKEGGPADPSRMSRLADQWLSYMKTVPQVWYDIPLVVPEPPKTQDPLNKDGTRPPFPGRP